MKGVANYSCGPFGDNVIAKSISWAIRKILDFFELNFERACRRHDYVWTEEHGGPNTRDDIEFALNVYDDADDQGSDNPWFWSLSGFFCVRIMAFFYKGLKYVRA